ncbi:MAG: hypothetical protein L3K52_08700 [Candidatus Thiothrix sulfatifontis]|nr:MAG: hypothetical protein L3K52_08700 [Candidatus Thiothrix sulfatifontis]
MSSHAVLADISGKVFRDFNANATFDTGASFNEVGMAGVTVKAFDATGAEKASATSGADGAYTLNGLTAGADYRVEFLWAESWLKPGASGGTSVQFAKDGATELNFSLNAPEDFSQENPQLATSNFLIGAASASEMENQPRIVEFGTNSGDFATNGDVFDTLDREVDSIAISSAPSSTGTFNAMPPDMSGRSRTDTVKISSLGPVLGMAYHRSSNQLLAASFMKRFAGFNQKDDAALGTIYAINRNTNPNSVTPFYTANAGSDVHEYTTPDLGVPSGDKDAATQVGKSGWGDIDLTPDGGLLYAVNLFDKKLYAIPVSMVNGNVTAGTASLISFPASITTDRCSGGDWVPGAVKVAQGSVYAGITCTGESVQGDYAHFYVYKFTIGEVTPTFTKVADFAKYPRAGEEWHSWINDVDRPGEKYAQPWLLDIEFDGKGRMHLGIRNRSGDMRPGHDGNDFIMEYGDTVTLAPNTDGTYALIPATAEFIADNTDGHAENDMGLLAVIPGINTLMSIAHIGNLIQGVRTYDSSPDLSQINGDTMQKLKYFALNQTPREISKLSYPFGKVAGLGDLEVLAAPAPVEVGNRVWKDTDNDGIQDAGEAGIDGVDVVLTCGTDTATVKTANGGQFLFSTASNAAFMTAGESCKITVASVQTPLAGLSVTAQNADTVTDNNPLTDVRDSDAIATGELAFTVGGAGENNHALDIGYKSAPAQTDIKLTKEVNPVTAKRGDTVVYTLTVTNESDVAATGVTVADKLPDGVVFVSHDGAAAGVYNAGTAEWDVGELLPGVANAKTLNITVTVK